jgi:hypothetical protein
VGPFVPAVLTGARAGAHEFQVTDPVEAALRVLHREYLAGHNESTAAQMLLGFVASAEDPDRLLAVKIIFERR